jgi:hypothetical protein
MERATIDVGIVVILLISRFRGDFEGKAYSRRREGRVISPSDDSRDNRAVIFVSAKIWKDISCVMVKPPLANQTTVQWIVAAFYDLSTDVTS